MLVVADEAQVGVAHQHAGQQAGLAQDLEAVADAEHEAAARRMRAHRVHDRRPPGDRAAAQVVAIGEAARQHDEIGPGGQRRVGVPDRRDRGARLAERPRGIAVAVRAGEDDDGGLHRRAPAGGVRRRAALNARSGAGRRSVPGPRAGQGRPSEPRSGRAESEWACSPGPGPGPGIAAGSAGRSGPQLRRRKVHERGVPPASPQGALAGAAPERLQLFFDLQDDLSPERLAERELPGQRHRALLLSCAPS